MANGGFRQGPKKETVYGGPTPTAQGTVYGGPPAGGTVYNGGATGSVYRPPSQSGGAGARATAVPPGAMASRLFFTVAGLSVLNSVLSLTGFAVSPWPSAWVPRAYSMPS